MTHSVSFASSMASFSVVNVLTHKTGPNTSSLQICMEVLTSVMMVGSMKNPFLICCHFSPYNSIKNTKEMIT